ncbi:MAG: hypothetical protein ACHQIG_00200 [Acidimicrobiia bacterium]
MDIKHRTKQLIATVALAGAVTAGTAGVAFAADSGSTTPSTPSAQAHHPRLRRALGGVVADTIGISRADLRDALKGGQTIGEVAQAHGVAGKAVVDAVVAAVDSRVDQAVANNRITADRGATIKTKVAEKAPQLLDHVFGQHAAA